MCVCVYVCVCVAGDVFKNICLHVFMCMNIMCLDIMRVFRVFRVLRVISVISVIRVVRVFRVIRVMRVIFIRVYAIHTGDTEYSLRTSEVPL